MQKKKKIHGWLKLSRKWPLITTLFIVKFQCRKNYIGESALQKCTWIEMHSRQINLQIGKVSITFERRGAELMRRSSVTVKHALRAPRCLSRSSSSRCERGPHWTAQQRGHHQWGRAVACPLFLAKEAWRHTKTGAKICFETFFYARQKSTNRCCVLRNWSADARAQQLNPTKPFHRSTLSHLLILAWKLTVI